MSTAMNGLRGLQRMRHIGVLTCAVLAVMTLPQRLFPWPWLLGMAVPSVISFVAVRRLPIRNYERGLVAAALQIGAIVICLRWLGPLDRLAALGCTLVPPLVFLALRADALDVLRVVFLSFCVLLIGAILGTPTLATLVAFLIAAALSLHLDVATSGGEERASWRGPPPGTIRRIGTAMSIGLATLAAFLVALQAMRALPNPQRDARGRAHDAGSVSGLSSDFAFANLQGSLLAIRSSRIIDVATGDGRPIPSDLYLRCGEFDVAGLDSWDARPYGNQRIQFESRRGVMIAPRLDDAIERTLQITIVEPGTGFAYVPPGSFALAGTEPMLGGRNAGVFRFASIPPAGTVYTVAYQNIHADNVDALPDNRLAALTEIGADLRPWLGMFDAILAEPAVRREVEPMRLARAIGDSLGKRCSYALHEPTGPHRHSLLNFLEGSREGFCMHFASVTAICLRRAGIPARIGVGLYGGEANEGEWGTRSYGSQHAHAWVEIPFADYGWVVFDPTPPSAREHLRWPQFDPDADPGAAGADTGDTGHGEGFRVQISLETAWPWALGLVALLIVVQMRFDRRTTRGKATPSVTAEARTARKLLERILRDLTREGHGRLRGETLEAYAERLDAADIATSTLRDAFAAYQEVRFGARPFDALRRERLSRPISDG